MKSSFMEPVDRLTSRIKKKDTWFQKALPPGLRVAVTPRHLATSDSYNLLMYSFRLAHNTISYMVKQGCMVIVAEYSKEVFNIPTASDEWRGAAELFNIRWYNSIVLMALVDADYKFMWVNVGSPGSCSDVQIWNDCDLRDHIVPDRISWPQPDHMMTGTPHTT
ncbi:uncharacterized protein LOC121390308 [Gigantopelta aegis]|uniref:uncharacterized protein LOC121390308 n=1 Tax=Gigantopelta aegis TaxID=1735272 RepID=UPI001B88E3EE|nr:uncharacterized protein LOC121390308 [Gigantopelta aegis]